MEVLEGTETSRPEATHFEFGYALRMWIRQIQYHCAYYKFADANGWSAKATSSKPLPSVEPAATFGVLAQQTIMTSQKFADVIPWNKARDAVRHRLQHRGCTEVSKTLAAALDELKSKGLVKEPNGCTKWKHIQRTKGSDIRASETMKDTCQIGACIVFMPSPIPLTMPHFLDPFHQLISGAMFFKKIVDLAVRVSAIQRAIFA